MNTDNITNRNFLNMHFISAVFLVSLVVIAPSLISQEQQSFGQQQQSDNTEASTTAPSNQSAAASSSANASLVGNNTPIGSNITTEDILELASLFNDQPFQGGQVSPRVAKWVNNDVFVFLQFDERTPSNATAINFIGIGKRGTFCEEDRPSADFVHFHKWNATEYSHGHGNKAGDEGYWLMWVATGEFDVQGRQVKPGIDREFSPTPPPSKCER
jgi:hypothetical protein